MTALTREQILARKTTGRTPQPYVLPDGSSIMVQGMTHGEAMASQVDDTGQRYDLMIHFGTGKLLSPEDAQAWRDVEEVNVIEGVVAKIMELSGLGEGAGKSGVPSAG
jgi:hypothetical protein